jgi:hypothetical protein
MNISYSSLSQLHGELSIDLLKSDFSTKIKSELKRIRQTAQVKDLDKVMCPSLWFNLCMARHKQKLSINCNELVNNYQKIIM